MYASNSQQRRTTNKRRQKCNLGLKHPPEWVPLRIPVWMNGTKFDWQGQRTGSNGMHISQLACSSGWRHLSWSIQLGFFVQPESQNWYERVQSVAQLDKWYQLANISTEHPSWTSNQLGITPSGHRTNGTLHQLVWLLGYSSIEYGSNRQSFQQATVILMGQCNPVS